MCAGAFLRRLYVIALRPGYHHGYRDCLLDTLCARAKPFLTGGETGDAGNRISKFIWVAAVINSVLSFQTNNPQYINARRHQRLAPAAGWPRHFRTHGISRPLVVISSPNRTGNRRLANSTWRIDYRPWGGWRPYASRLTARGDIFPAKIGAIPHEEAFAGLQADG